MLALPLLLLIVQYSFGLEPPALTKRVTDNAGMLSQPTKQQLESILAGLESTDSTQIAVLTIASLEGESLERFSLKVVEKWQLGHEGRDNGALLLVARDERKIRIEVGYGLEGVLTDLTAGRIIRNVITPRFKEGNFDRGIIDGVTAMVAAVKGEFKAEDYGNKSRDGDDNFIGYLIFTFFALFNIGKIFGRNKLLTGVVGAAGLPLVSWLMGSFSLPIILGLIPVGFIVGYLSALVFGRTPLSRTSRVSRRSSSRHHHGGFGGGGFGGGSFGGGFSGGGGGFGGGGASGGW